MKKILALALVLIMMFAIAAPAAFADDGTETAAGEPVVFSVEKHPTSETIKSGGKVIFMAYPKGERIYTTYWTFENEDGDVIEAENANEIFPGLIVEFPDRQRIRLRNVPEIMDGLRVQAHFANKNGETVHSDYAFLFVEPGKDVKPCEGTKPCENPCGVPCNQPVPQPCAPIVITKPPYDELFLRDGQSSTYFEAHADNYAWMSWEFKIGDYGTPFSAEAAARDYGLNLSGFNSTQLWIHNITWGINGWYVRAVFYDCDGCPTYSSWAFMRLVEYVEKPCKPACPPPNPCYVPCYDPYLTPCNIVPSCVYPETTVSYTHTEIDSVTVETTYPGSWF